MKRKTILLLICLLIPNLVFGFNIKAQGDILGPSSSTDNTIPRFDSTTGKLLQGSGVTIDDSNNMIFYSLINTVQAETCTDNTVGASAQALTITPTSSYIEITNADADGCNITMSETGMVAGRVATLCVVSNAGATVNFADTAGVTELAGAFTANIDDCITIRYGNTTTWREVSRSAN